MNNRKERLRSFSCSGEKERKQYVWTKNEKGEKILMETTPIDIQQEIESYADECDIKTIVAKAAFDPEFAKAVADTGGGDIDVSGWPTNIHEYHQMIATAEATAMQLQAEAQKAEAQKAEAKKGETQNEPE
nr:MAG TPA: Scaffold protein [Microviridae sp.]